jgi:hypothetical protein
VPELFAYRVEFAVTLIVLIAAVNLRGIRESGAFFASPTYVYLVSIFGLLAVGMFRFLTGTMPDYDAPAAWLTAEAAEPLGILLLLRAFASGSVALTGVEAVSNGVPAFKPPEPRRAQTVLILMGTFFAVIFLGLSFLAGQLGVLPDPTEQETVISQVTRSFVVPARRSTTSSRCRPRSSSSWPQTPRLLTSRACRASWPATASCRASSRSEAIGSPSATGSSCWPRSPSSWWCCSAAA